MRIALAQINPTVGSLVKNREKICHTIVQAKKRGAEIVLFPEMALIGYPPEDLVLLPSFIDAVQKELEPIIDASQGIAVIVGTVRKNPSGEKRLFNTAAVIEDRELLGFHDKILLPDYDVFSERRYFEPGSHMRVWELRGRKIGITICEDIWQHAKEVEYSYYPRDPVLELKEKQPFLMLNLSASPYYMHRKEIRFRVCSRAAQTLGCPVFLCNQVGANDSLIFDGGSLYVDSHGHLSGHAKVFEEDLLVFDLNEKNPPLKWEVSYVEDLYHALALGTRDYFHKQGFTHACIGLSGGIDSAVVACVAVEALGAKNVKTFYLPSRFSSPESREDAMQIAESLNVACAEISIEPPFESFLEVLAPHFEGRPFDQTEENLQARIRGVLLMAFSNKFGCLVLSTANKSEMAMGYSTLYGDMCGGLAILSDVTKEQTYALARWINDKKEVIPQRVLEKEPTAELRPNQKDTDSLPPYPIVDVVLTAYVEQHLSPEEIASHNHLPLALVKDLVRKIHKNEYKRRQAPPGLRVTKKALIAGRRFPIVQHWNCYDT